MATTAILSAEVNSVNRMASHANDTTETKILILATESCAYPGADSVGQAHFSYPANCYILRIRAPVLFPERFYIDCFRKGIGGIIIMSCGEECPYEGAYKALAKRLDRVYQIMKQEGMDIRRLRLTAICTVCTRAFLNEVNQMNRIVQGLGPHRFGRENQGDAPAEIDTSGQSDRIMDGGAAIP
jgi:F420-non-reducing hydrogenase iron-sulfur subunit